MSVAARVMGVMAASDADKVAKIRYTAVPWHDKCGAWRRFIDIRTARRHAALPLMMPRP